MAFPTTPTNGQVVVVNNINYQYANTTNTWTRILTTANVITANTISVNGALSAAGNISTGNYFIGNGSLLTGIATGTPTLIANGTSNVAVTSSGGNIRVNVGGTSNVIVYATTGEYVTGIVSASGNIISAGNVTGGNIVTGGLVSATSTVTGSTLIGSVVTASGNITGGNVLTGGLISATANITGGNIVTGGLISVTGNITGGNITIPGSANISTFIGNVFFGSIPAQPTWYTIAPLNLNNSLAAATKVQLNLINTGGGAGAGSAIDFYTYQISVAAANAEARIAGIDDGNYSAYLSLQTKTPGSTGTNGLVERVKIDSTGASVVANVTGGNLLTGGLISATGNVTGNYILGNGALLTGVITSVANINNGTSNVTVVSSGGNVTVGVGGTSNVAVFSTTGEYVTGVVSASGNITGGNVISGGVRVFKWTTQANTAPSNAVPGDAWYDSYAGKYYLYINDGTGNQWVDQSPPTSFANLTVSGTLSAAGNITGNYFIGNGSALTGIATGTPTKIVNGTSEANIGASGGNANITIGGTSNVVVVASTGLYVSGLMSSTGNAIYSNLILNGTAAAGSGVLIVSGNIQTSTANATANIGNASNYFNRLFAQATTALYADLAEIYKSDAQYPPGTVLVFGGNQEVTISTQSHDAKIAGVVSTNPAHVMNSGMTSEFTVEVGLIGRVPCQVVGPISAGDRVVSSNRAGVAERLDMSKYQPGVIIGKALETYSGTDIGTIEVVVGRL